MPYLVIKSKSKQSNSQGLWLWPEVKWSEENVNFTCTLHNFFKKVQSVCHVSYHWSHDHVNNGNGNAMQCQASSSRALVVPICEIVLRFTWKGKQWSRAILQVGAALIYNHSKSRWQRTRWQRFCDGVLQKVVLFSIWALQCAIIFSKFTH